MDIKPRRMSVHPARFHDFAVSVQLLACLPVKTIYLPTYLRAFEPCRSYEQAERGLETSFLPEARQPCMYACMLARSGIWTCRCRLPSIVYRLCIRGAAAGSREGWMTGGRELWRWTLLFFFEIFTIDRPPISQSLDTSS